MSSITHVMASQVDSLRLGQCNHQLTASGIQYLRMYDMDVDLVG